ncbi:MAG: ABC transporter permease [Methanocella sp.]
MPQARMDLGRRLIAHRESGVFVAMVLVYAVFFLLKPEFLTPRTLGDIVTVAAELGTVAAGVSFLMISGEFDLSVGSNFALTAMLVAMLTTKSGWNPWLAFVLAMVLSGLIGGLNGLVTLSFRIPSFIATLGAMMFWRGIGLFLTQGWPISVFEDLPLLRVLGAQKIWATAHISALWWVVASLACAFVLTRTPYGNWVFATGGRLPAAKALGVPVRRVKLTNFIVCGLLAGFAGCMQFGRMGSMSPVWGQELQLEAIAASVIGGNAQTGGVGTILGTFLGALTIASIRIGLVMVGAPAYWYMSFLGVIVILAVVINVKLGEVIAWRR